MRCRRQIPLTRESCFGPFKLVGGIAKGHPNDKDLADAVTMAKGLAGGIPVGGILADEKVSDVLVPGDHGTTFGGNALAMAAANVVLDELEKPEFLADVAKKGDYIMDTVKSWGLDEIVEVRGKGLMIGIGDGSDMIKPMAIAIIGGLVYGTILDRKSTRLNSSH